MASTKHEDFLGEPIKVGDLIVYGHTACHDLMEVTICKDDGCLQARQVEHDTLEIRQVPRRRFRRRPDLGAGWDGKGKKEYYDDGMKLIDAVHIDNLHRVMVVTWLKEQREAKRYGMA